MKVIEPTSRLQLINSVIASIKNFWSFAFCLPQGKCYRVLGLVEFWLDIWHPMGHLIDVYGEIGTKKLGICRNARVCDVVVGTEWRFRSTRDRTLQAIVSQVRSFPSLLHRMKKMK
ncbi:BnaCnng32360D [Brassica napus]|uniref:BnaCnng32360D protein n=1 Tax=Brassica napus TaxID=3708 RepID=A0A078J511_BRANA|nr:BnaCnng32360D [Brassica napus]